MATPVQNFTFTKLLQLLPGYMERDDSAFKDQVPTFIALAENRLATDMKTQGFQSVVKGKLPITNVMPKPAFWRETINFSYYNDAGEKQPLQLRSLEYATAFWPNPAVSGLPRFYADYNINNFYLAATPLKKYDFELVFYARLQPLSTANDSNWMTLNAPQALFYAIMLEAALWTKNKDREATFQAQYEMAKQGLMSENSERLADRTTVVTRG